VVDRKPTGQLGEGLAGLAMLLPAEARRRAQQVLASDASPLDRTYALQALGIVERESDHTGRAIVHFRRAVSLSEAAGLTDRRVDLTASLATALGMAGRRQAAIEAFADALSRSRGVQHARVLVRRCGVLAWFGDMEEASQDGRRAAQILRRTGDHEWEAHARHNVALALMHLGRFAEAEREFVRAQQLEESSGESYRVTVTLHSRGDCALRQGDLPKALRLLYQARDRYRDLGVVPSDVARDLAVVLVAAGMTEEATIAADELVEVLEADRASAGRRADGLIAAATVHLDHGNAERAIGLARRAVRANHRQGNAEGERHSKLVLLKA
jgi:tetratricopeptide (TPR) repeat protein